MKTKLFKTIALGLLAWAFLAPSQATAQVANPYQIINNMPCKVDIRYEFYRPYADGSCGSLCFAGGMTVPPSPPPTFINHIPPCQQTCGVRIYLVAIGGVPITPVIVDDFNLPPTPPPNPSGIDPSGCSPTGQINLLVTPGAAHINP